MTTGIFEYDNTTGAKKGALSLIGELVGYTDTGAGIYRKLDVKYLGANTVPRFPGPPTVSGSMPSRTSTSISWTPYAELPDTPAVTSWQVQRAQSTDNGATFTAFADVTGSPFSASTLTLSQSGLSTGTPEIIWAYRVRGTNSVGTGEWSNEKRLQWNSTPAQQPTAPTSLTRGTLTSTEVTLNWQETADATVTKHGIFEGNTLVVDNLNATALSYTWTGLTPGSTHTNVNVRRWNGQWSPASNMITFTMLTSNPPSFTMLMGCSASNNDHGGTEVWDGWRVYTEGNMLSLANRTGSQRPKFLAYSESGENLGGSNPNYTTIFNHVRTVLDDFYYNGSGQTRSSRWGIKLYWSNGNENFDKGALATPHTSTGIANYVTSQKALYDAVHYIDPVTNSRRYPDAFAGSNPTQNAEQQGLVADWLHPSARYHDFVMWSMYPPGRSSTPGDPTYNYPSFNEANRNDLRLGFLIRCFYRTFQAQAQARIDTGNNSFALAIGCGEVGIGDDPNDSTTRPYYAVHGLAGGMYKLAQQYGLAMPFACWWDNQSDATAPQNILSDEPVTTNPSTRVAWQTWMSLNHQFGGTHPTSWAGNPKSTWKTTGTVV